VVNRSRWLDGYDVAYVPGWDTHGLPIEHLALSQSGLSRHADPMEIRRRSREFALRHVATMTEEFRRLGVLGDWEHPYRTLDPAYEAAEVRVFGQMYRQGLIQRRLRSVLWCPVCETALADAEIEYSPEESPSLYVGFPLVDRGHLPADTWAVIWTTTAWTLPMDEAVAVHPDLAYEAVPTARGHLLLARGRAEEALAAMGLSRQGEGPVVRGRDLEGLTARPPFGRHPVPIVLGNHVTEDEGTGLVHTAPGHGAEDFEVGQHYGLAVRVGVDGAGRMTAEAGPFAGLDWRQVEGPVVEALSSQGVLLAAHRLVHEYPHCWRCKGPVLFRATEQWFCTLDPLREKLKEAVHQVRWEPPWGEERMAAMLAGRDDWCISRQRVWGLPIPVLWCRRCHTPVVTEQTIEHLSALFAREGADVWFGGDPGRLTPPGLRCPSCQGDQFDPDPDTLDVWFDSGSSQAAVLQDPRYGLHWPADLYLEGTDQFRGWFNLSMITSVATQGKAPFRQLLCHGFVVDGEGRKMSKSLGNGIDAMEAVEERGADVLRLWAVSADFTADTRLSPQILDQVGDAYRKLRNTLRFLLGNLWDFDPSTHAVAPSHLGPLDRWALGRLAQVAKETVDDYRALRLHAVYRRLYAYATVDLSARYLDMRKDVLYAEAPDSPRRRSAQTALYTIAGWLIRLLLPVVPFTAEEAWEHLPHLPQDPPYVQMTEWPSLPPVGPEDQAYRAGEALLSVRDQALAALESMRLAGEVGAGLDASLFLRLPEELASHARALEEDVSSYFGVSQVTWEVEPGPAQVSAARASGKKCVRCWRVLPEVEADGELCRRCREVVRVRAVAPRQG
jgi:isoleucyl-tRNA synthetase